MPIRSGMQPLVDRLRAVIGDTGDPSVFTDDELQAALDERRRDSSAVEITGDYVLSGSPTVFRSNRGFWEATAVLSSSAGVVQDPDGDATDPLAGVWAFAAAPGATVYVTGRNYDLWGTAANLLEQWAARTALEFDFGTDQQMFNRSDKRKSLLAVAREFGRRALPAGR